MNATNKTIFLAIIFLIFVSLFLQSCDPFRIIQWKVINNTDDNITIYSKSYQDTILNFNYVGSQTSILILEEDEIGTVKSKFEYTDKIPFEKFIILNSAGDTLKTDAYLTENWEKNYIDKDNGEFILEVTDLDF